MNITLNKQTICIDNKYINIICFHNNILTKIDNFYYLNEEHIKYKSYYCHHNYKGDLKYIVFKDQHDRLSIYINQKFIFKNYLLYNININTKENFILTDYCIYDLNGNVRLHTKSKINVIHTDNYFIYHKNINNFIINNNFIKENNQNYNIYYHNNMKNYSIHTIE